MYIKVASFLLLGALVVGVVLFLPFWWLAKRYIKSHSDSVYSRRVTKETIGYQSIFVIILFAGFASQYYAPNSVIGKLVSSGFGKVLYLLDVIALEHLVRRIWVAASRRSAIAKVKELISKVSIEPCSGVSASDESIPENQAYAVELFNDDKTSMEFVISLFCTCFGMDVKTASQKMLEVHRGRSCKLGRLTQDNALLLVEHIKQQAAKYNYPFRCEVVAFNDEIVN